MRRIIAALITSRTTSQSSVLRRPPFPHRARAGSGTVCRKNPIVKRQPGEAPAAHRHRDAEGQVLCGPGGKVLRRSRRKCPWKPFSIVDLPESVTGPLKRGLRWEHHQDAESAGFMIA
jgi:hypothetical protein